MTYLSTYSKKFFAFTVLATLLWSVLFLVSQPAFASLECEVKRAQEGVPVCQSVDVNALGFKIPSLADILTFVIRGFFAIAGLAGMFYMLLGAFSWVTSGGDKDAITASKEKIQAAVIGMLLIVGVLAIIWTLEQVIFQKRVCLGLTCPVTIPGLIEKSRGPGYCCLCTNETTGQLGVAIDAYKERCLPNGKGQSINQ